SRMRITGASSKKAGNVMAPVCGPPAARAVTWIKGAVVAPGALLSFRTFAAPGGPAAMLLMIDNYDSFTWNLVQYLQALGAEVRVERNDALTVDEIARLRPEKIVISPGPCTPDEAGVSLEVVR